MILETKSIAWKFKEIMIYKMLSSKSAWTVKFVGLKPKLCTAVGISFQILKTFTILEDSA